MNLTFAGADNAVDYCREVNLATGIVRITYRIGNAVCTREMFSSVPDQALVVRLTCDKSGRLSFHATLTRSQDSKTTTAAPDRVILEGEAIADTDFWMTPNLSGEKLQKEKDQLEPTGVRFRAELRAINEGGHVEVSGSDVIASNADTMTLLLVAATKYRGGDPAAQCAQYLAHAAQPYAQLKTSHLADHERLFRRVDLEPAQRVKDDSIESLPTDERLARVRQGKDDPGLAALFYQFWPLPADGKQPPRNDGGQSPRHLE